MERFLAGVLVALLPVVGGCFADETAQTCEPGAPGCQCQQQQCQAGLTCVDDVCMSMVGTDGTSTSTSGADGSSSMSSSASTTTDTTSGTSTTTGTTTSTVTSTTSDGSTGASGSCGDGILDSDEECDGTLGCTTECELENYDCNPLTNMPCSMGFKCAYVEDAMFNPNFTCLPFNDPPPGVFGEESCYYEAFPHDEWCDVGLACATASLTNTCNMGGGCCVEYCDLLDQDFQCQTPEDDCVATLGGAAPPGLSNLGWCVTP